MMKIWISVLSLCSEDDYKMKDLIKSVRKETEYDITSFGWSLCGKRAVRDYDEALGYYQNELDIKMKLGDLMTIATAYTEDIGQVYSLKKNLIWLFHTYRKLLEFFFH